MSVLENLKTYTLDLIDTRGPRRPSAPVVSEVVDPQSPRKYAPGSATFILVDVGAWLPTESLTLIWPYQEGLPDTQLVIGDDALIEFYHQQCEYFNAQLLMTRPQSRVGAFEIHHRIPEPGGGEARYDTARHLIPLSMFEVLHHNGGVAPPSKTYGIRVGANQISQPAR
jgi:hypothetical protein